MVEYKIKKTTDRRQIYTDPYTDPDLNNRICKYITILLENYNGL